MSEVRGIKETKEAIQGVFVLVRKGWEIRKDGVSGLPKLVEAYGPVRAGIEGANEIDDEMKDLDPAETEAMVKLLITELGTTFEAMGFKSLSKYIPLAAKAIDNGRQTYELWKDFGDDLKKVTATTVE